MELFILDCDWFAGGRREEVHFDKITSRIQKLCYGLNMDFVDPVRQSISLFVFPLCLCYSRYARICMLKTVELIMLPLQQQQQQWLHWYSVLIS